MNVISQMTTRRTRPMQRDLRVKILGPPHCGGAYIPEVGKGGCKRRESTTACCERKRVVAFPFLECGRLAAAFTVHVSLQIQRPCKLHRQLHVRLKRFPPADTH